MDILLELKKYMEFNYPIEIRFIPENEGGGVAASIPFLGKDAFVGDGETIEEAIKNLNRLKRELFEYYLENNISIPSPLKEEEYSGKFVVRVPKYLHQELVERANDNGISLNTLCVSLLSQKVFETGIKKLLKDVQYTIRTELNRYMYDESLQILKSKGPVRYFRENYGKAS